MPLGEASVINQNDNRDDKYENFKQSLMTLFKKTLRKYFETGDYILWEEDKSCRMSQAGTGSSEKKLGPVLQVWVHKAIENRVSCVSHLNPAYV